MATFQKVVKQRGSTTMTGSVTDPEKQQIALTQHDTEDEETNVSKYKEWKVQLKTKLNPVLGLLLTATSALMFGFANVIVKLMSDVDPFTIAFYRFFFMFLMCIPLVVYNKIQKGTLVFPAGYRLAIIVRSILGSTNLLFHFYALKHLPVADTNLIASTSPMFTVISARIFLKEEIVSLDIINIFLVLTGIVLIVRPPFLFGDYDAYKNDPELMVAVILLIVGAALLQANVYVILRFLKELPASTVVFNFGWIGSIVCGVSSLIFGCRCIPMGVDTWLYIIIISVISHVAQLTLTGSAKFESAAKVSLYRKAFDILFSVALQIIFFQDIPDTLKIVGAVLITGAVLLSGMKKVACKKDPPQE